MDYCSAIWYMLLLSSKKSGLRSTDVWIAQETVKDEVNQPRLAPSIFGKRDVNGIRVARLVTQEQSFLPEKETNIIPFKNTVEDFKDRQLESKLDIKITIEIIPYPLRSNICVSDINKVLDRRKKREKCF